MSTAEKHNFQAEIQQLLDIVIHSLYTDKEIFVRELISNAADACEKLRFLQSAGQPIYQPETSPAVVVVTDEKTNTITFADTGLGMTHDELVENLGTIAHSGTKAFLQTLAGLAPGQEAKPDAKLIGQFGVGFYSAFMAAAKVTVTSRSYRPEEAGWSWTSEGPGGYQIESAADLPRGTKIVLQLKDDAKDFAKKDNVERIIKRYSDFVPFPIELNGQRLNTVQGIWSRNKNEIKDEEYHEFYHYIAHDPENPLYRLHFTADAPLAIQSLLFVPSRNFEMTGMPRLEGEVNLYCRRVLIQARAKGLLPDWLRFLKGVVDSEDLPLNISRETMQDSALLKKLNQVLTGRFLRFLEEQAEKAPDTYAKFYAEHSRFLKEGLVSDFHQREPLGKLLRYESSALEPGQLTSLAAYRKRMPSEQTELYYLLAPNRETALSSPYFEVFQARKWEVLFLYDPWDEFVMEHLHQFEDKTVRPAEKAEVALADAPAPASALTDEQAQALAQWMKTTLGERIKEVRVSHRLVDSPAVILDSDKMLTTSMRRILRTLKKEGEAATTFPQDLEINPRHPILARLEVMRQTESDLARIVAEQILDNARVAAGLLEDPRTMLKRLNDLLARVLTPK
jgi:TNF receptor-associated protein 1